MAKIQTTRIYAEIQKAFDTGYTTVSEQGSSRCFGKGTLVRMADGTLKAVEDIVKGDKLMNMSGDGYNTVVETHNGIDELYLVKQKRGIDYVVNSKHILTFLQTRAKCHKVAIEGYKSAEKRRIEMLPFDRSIIHDFDIKFYMAQSENFRKRYTHFKNTMLQLPHKDVRIDPYYLGLWLGDGTSIRPYEISNVDKEILDYFYALAESLGTKAYHRDGCTHDMQICVKGTRNLRLKGKIRDFCDGFRYYNLYGNKYIPKEYIYNDYETRLKLLAGLIDSDGCQSNRKTICITQMNETIMKAVEEICRISGFYTSGYYAENVTMKRKDGSVYKTIAYHIEINHNDFKDLNKYILLERKRVQKQCDRDYFASSISIEPCGKGKYYGFTLDNSPYFLLQDGTVAHNSSKTYNTCIWLVVRALSFPNTTISIVRKTLPAIKRTVWRDFKEILFKTGAHYKENKQEFIYEFDNGSWIEFFSCDNEQKVRGSKRQILFVNEGNELTFLEWQQLQMRTTLFSIIDYNPSFSEEHWICALNDEPKTYFFIGTYKDNPFLEQKVIEEIESLRTKSPTLWQVYGLGQRAIIEGRIFKTFKLIDELPYQAKRHRFIGMDYGYANDPTAIVYVSIVGKTIYLRELCYQTEMLTKDIIRRYKEISREYQWQPKVWAECAEPRENAEIYNAGIDIHPVRKYPGSIIAGLQKMQEYELCVTKDSINLIKELKNYTYRKDKNGKWLNEPIDAFNHAIDAIRYVIISEVLGQNDDGLDAQGLADIL
jgi:phage terminase large subunit